MANYEYPAIVYKQRNTAEQPFCICTARVGEVNNWARVDRLRADNKMGVQREKRDARVEAIRHFLTIDPRNTIPTAIVIALQRDVVELEGVTFDEIGLVPQTAKLKIKTSAENPQPGLIIDGQHRAGGISKFDPATPVNIVILLGAVDDEIAFQFVVINNKVSKVSPDHIKALKLGYSEANLDARLVKSARVRSSGQPAHLDQIDTQEDSPFKGRLKWPRNADPANDVEGLRAIPLSAFEVALASIATRRIDQTIESDPDPEFVVRFFLEIWKAVQREWAAAWDAPASKLLHKIGIVCLTEWVVNTLVGWSTVPTQKIDLTNLDEVSDMAVAALKLQEPAFWTANWNDASLDTASGRKLVVDAMNDLQRNKTNGLPWNTNVKLLTLRGQEP